MSENCVIVSHNPVSLLVVCVSVINNSVSGLDTDFISLHHVFYWLNATVNQ